MAMKLGYKQTDVGNIPIEWNAPVLGGLFDFKNGLNKGKEYFGHGTPIVNYMDVYRNCGLYAHDLLGRVDVSKQELKAFEVRKGDVFFTRTSETVEEVGIASVMLNESPDTVFSGFVLRARPKNDNLDDQFKKYCFSPFDVRKQITSKSTYTTRALTNGRLLSAVAIACPPKPEQRAIAEALSDVDALVDTLEKLIVKKQDLKQAAMQQLLTGKQRLPGLSGKWEVKRLGEVATIATGNTPPTRNAANYGDEFPFVGPVDLGEGKFVLDTEKKLSKAGFAISRRFPKGSVLFTCIGSTIGKSGIAPVELTSNQQINAIFPSPSFSNEYLYYSLCLLAPKIRALAGEQAVPIVNKSQFSDTEVSLPSLPEQNAIAAVLSDMDAEIDALEVRRDKTRALKQGMMQELLTGKTRLI